MTDPNNKYTYLDQLSIEKLEELLRLDVDTSCNQENDEYIDAIMEVIQKKEKEHSTGRLTDVNRAWADFQKHFNTSEGKNLSLYPDEDASEPQQAIQDPIFRATPKHHRLRYIMATSVVVICLIIFMLPSVLGYKSFSQMIGQWTADIFQFNLNVEESAPPLNTNTDNITPKVPGEYTNLQEALDDHKIAESVVPTWIPDGFELKNILIQDFPDSGKTEFNAFYSSNENSISLSYIQYNVPQTRAYEKDSSSVQVYITGDVSHYIFENNGQFTATWYVGTIECSIRTDLSPYDLEKMIDSIYER